MHALALGSTDGALFKSKYSYNFSLKRPVTLNPGGIINSRTMPMTPAKDGNKAEFNHAECAIFNNVLGFGISHTLELGSTNFALH